MSVIKVREHIILQLSQSPSLIKLIKTRLELPNKLIQNLKITLDFLTKNKLLESAKR